MKRILIYLSSLFILLNLSAQETTIMRHCDKFQISSGGSSIIKLVPNKAKRLSSSLGSLITAKCDPGLSEEMQFCIKAATELWAEQLTLNQPIVLHFSKERMGAGNQDIITDVYYHNSEVTTGISYPYAYAVNIGEVTRNSTSATVDADIIINEDVNWDYGFSGSIDTSKKNLTTAILRNIAVSLGFTTSVWYNAEKNGILFHNRRNFTPFDNLIVNSNNVLLNTMPNMGRPDPTLTSYVTGNNVYLKYPNNVNYKLFAPSVFEQYNSLVFFENSGSLMSRTIQSGDKILAIDDRTLDVVRLIGWKTQQMEINIVGEGIDNTGIVSSYKPYQFHAECTSGTISKFSWKYELLNKNKEYVNIKASNAPTFSIDPVANESLYDKNLDGDLQGRIILEATVNGKTYKKTFSLYLEVKPTFLTVKIDAITPDEARDYYDLDVTIIYGGVDYLYYEFSQEFSHKVATDFVREPYLVHLHFNGVYMRGMSWLDLELNNNYGVTKYTLEIPRQDMAELHSAPSTNLPNTYSENWDVTYQVLNIQGQLILETDVYKDVKYLPKGIYILRTNHSDGQTETNKFIIR